MTEQAARPSGRNPDLGDRGDPQPRRRVLMIAYFFPPLGGAGVQRTLKFVRYLPEAGWDPVILTTAADWYPAHDRSLSDQIPLEGPVLRAPDPGVLRRFSAWLAPNESANVFRIGLTLAMSGLAVPALLNWPDPMVAWGASAFQAGRRAAERFRPDLIYSTSAPYTSHLVAMAIHRRFDLPWVADFRDEWAHNPAAKRHPLIRHLDRRAERAVLRSATAVTSVAEYFEMEGATSPIVIPNGVDEDDVAIGEGSGGARLRLAYVGTLYGPRNLTPVLRALRELAAERAIDPDRVELRIVGNYWVAGAPSAGPVSVTQTGYVEHSAAAKELADADALVFIAAPGSLAPSGKLFEYLASGRPIVCVCDEGNLAWRLVQEWQAGTCADPRDQDGVKRALLEIYRRWLGGPLGPQIEVRRAVLERYGRRRQAMQLAGIFDRLAARPVETSPGGPGSVQVGMTRW